MNPALKPLTALLLAPRALSFGLGLNTFRLAVGSITIPGVGYPHKRVLEIINNKPVLIDDVKIWSLF
jgi:hypothetical protein